MGTFYKANVSFLDVDVDVIFKLQNRVCFTNKY